MKKLILFFVLCTSSVFAQDITGSWMGELTVQGMKLPLILHIKKVDSAYVSTLDSPKQLAKGIPVQETVYQDGKLSINAKALGLTYVATWAGVDSLHGQFSQGGLSAGFGVKRTVMDEEQKVNRPQTPISPYPYYTEDFQIKNSVEGNGLAGTLAAPDKDLSRPIVVMITGSGAQNRDEELFGHKPFLVLADHLAKNGVASFRMDDRGVGGSEAGKSGATTADFAGDILSAVQFLAQRGYTKIGLVGHSEGGMIAPMVQDPAVKFMVLLAGPGIPITELMSLQNYEISKSMGVDDKLAKASSLRQNEIYKFMNSYQGEDFKKDLITFLQQKMQDPQAENTAAQLSAPWFRYFVKFDPSVYLKQVKVPVLALNGTKDLQVTAPENLAGIQKSLPSHPKTEIIPMVGLNHLFQTAKTGAPTEYAEIEETISPKVLEKIASWINGIF